MEGDTIMQDGKQLEYPDPRSVDHGPYPSISQIPHSVQASPNSLATSPSFHRQLAPRLGSAGAAAEYTSADLSGYFYHSDLDNIQYEDDDLDDIREVDSTYLESSHGEPWTDDFFSRLATAGNMEASSSPDNRGSRRGRPRSQGGRPGRGRGRGGWKWALLGTDHEDLFKRKGGPPRRKPRRPRGRPRTSVNASGQDWIDPGDEYKELQREATKAFLNGDNEKALEYAKAAVKVNSEVFMAHRMIDDILKAQGDERGAIIALSVGVNTKRDPELWAEIGNRILDLEDKDANDMEWARDCFYEAIKKNMECYSAHTGKLRLHEVLKETDQARLECKAIIKKWPEELDYVLKYARLCFQTRDSYEWERAKEAYEKSFEFYADSDILGDDIDEQWTHLNVYLDVLLKLGMYLDGIRQLKRLARWFLGRKDETFWDDLIDDREFDSTDERRMHIPQFQQVSGARDSSQYGDGLPLELRIKLGMLRMRMRQTDEAFRHFEHLKAVEPEGDGDEEMFLEVAECMRNESMFGEALKYYESIKPLQREGNQKFWMGIAHCYNVTGRKDEALQCYLTCCRIDEYNVNARIELARLYDRLDEPEKAAKVATEVVLLGKLDAIRRQSLPLYQNYAPRSLPLLLPKPNSTNFDFGQPSLSTSELSSLDRQRRQLAMAPPSQHTQLEQFSSQMRSLDMSERTEVTKTKRQRAYGHYSAIKGLPKATDADPDELMVDRWILHAKSIYTEFRATSRFYLGVEEKATKQANSLPSNLVEEMENLKRKAGEDSTPSDGVEIMMTAGGSTVGEFHGIPLAECHRIFSELALVFARRVDQDNCYEVLHHGLSRPNVFRLDEQMQNTTQAVRLCCALTFDDSKVMTEVAQELFPRDKKDSGMALQLFAATGRLSHDEAYFYDRKITKWLTQMLNTQDNSMFNVDFRLPALCGLNASAHNHGNARPALPYLLRALAAQPENPVVNLSIAVNYLANAMHKNTANRQVEIEQGLAFFYRYYDLRVASGEVGRSQEAEFNLARIWHQLGLAHLAVPAYEKVLRLSREVRKQVSTVGMAEAAIEDFAPEAAYALQALFLAAGNEDAAKAITEKWLVL